MHACGRKSHGTPDKDKEPAYPPPTPWLAIASSLRKGLT
jgi:hypothetical protein